MSIQSTEPITAPGVGVFAGQRASIGAAETVIDVANMVRYLIRDADAAAVTRRLACISGVAYEHGRADLVAQLRGTDRIRTFRISVEEL